MLASTTPLPAKGSNGLHSRLVWPSHFRGISIIPDGRYQEPAADPHYSSTGLWVHTHDRAVSH